MIPHIFFSGFLLHFAKEHPRAILIFFKDVQLSIFKIVFIFPSLLNNSLPNEESKIQIPQDFIDMATYFLAFGIRKHQCHSDFSSFSDNVFLLSRKL